MKRKVLAILVGLIMVVGLLPAVAFAEDYNVWVGGTRVTSENMNDVLGNGTVSYDPVHQILTLKGYDGRYIQATSHGLTVALEEGTVNTITVPHDVEKHGIYTLGDLTLTGAGDLAINVPNIEYGGARAEAGDIVIDMAGDLIVDAGKSGINADGAVTRSGAGAVTITADYAGIYAVDGDITLSGNGDVTITAKYGIFTSAVGKDIVVDMDGNLTIDDADSMGIFSKGDITLSGVGTVTIINADVNGIYAFDNVTLSGAGAVTIIASDDGIIALNGDVTFSGSGAVTITTTYNHGIYAKGGNVIHSGSGRLSVTAGTNAAFLKAASKSLLLNGTGVPLSFRAGDGYPAIYNDADGISPVGGSKLTYYNKVTGAPDTESVVYDRRSSGGGGGGAVMNYILTFNTNGGSAIGAVTKPAGTVISLADYVPAREGYDFAGWYSDEELTSAVTSVLLIHDSTVYARWTEGETKKAAPDEKLPFTDVKTDDWFYEPVKYLYENGIMQGTEEDTFSPEMTTTRGMIVAMLYRLEKEPPVSGQNPFNDVLEGSYYDEAINWAAANGIIEGTGEDKFGPDDNVTREEVAAILYRYAAFKGYDVTKTADLTKFSDSADISPWAVTAMSWANAEGLITGTTASTLSPSDNATRAQVATILYRFIKTY